MSADQVALKELLADEDLLARLALNTLVTVIPGGHLEETPTRCGEDLPGQFLLHCLQLAVLLLEILLIRDELLLG